MLLMSEVMLIVLPFNFLDPSPEVEVDPDPDAERPVHQRHDEHEGVEEDQRDLGLLQLPQVVLGVALPHLAPPKSE